MAAGHHGHPGIHAHSRVTAEKNDGSGHVRIHHLLEAEYLVLETLMIWRYVMYTLVQVRVYFTSLSQLKSNFYCPPLPSSVHTCETYWTDGSQCVVQLRIHSNYSFP